MKLLLKRLQNAFWSRRTGSSPSFESFYKSAEDIDASAYQGDVARIFFANKGPLVHKWLHYLEIYERTFARFRGKPFRFLEIGVSKGGSLQMWRSFFGDQATIFGIDINPDCAAINGQHGQVRIGSQDDPAFLASVIAEMGGVDIILDDGSHVARHQRVSFDILFPLLSDDGLYVIEDMHTAYWGHFEGGLRRPGTAIEMLKGKVDEMHRQYFERGRNDFAKMLAIESIQFFDSIAVVHKRAQDERRVVMVPAPEVHP